MLKQKFSPFTRKQIDLYKKQICEIGSFAWQEGLFPAYNGNISVKMNNGYILITASGTAKGKLDFDDISIIDFNGNQIEGKKISTENFLHLNIYNKTESSAIIHTHPLNLLALNVKNAHFSLADLPIYEAKIWSKFMCVAKKLEPGSIELAVEVGNTVDDLIKSNKKTVNLGAVWLSNHGLVSWGQNLKDALSLTEELEHLAEIMLLAN